MRDAILADIARNDEEREAARLMMTELASDGSIPASTILAALDYLDGEFTTAASRVSAILDAENYSLAQLLRNGLEMKAPAALLHRSLSHYEPEALCEG